MGRILDWRPFHAPAGGFGDHPGDRSGELRDTHEAWSVLAGLAALLPRIRIGSLVSGNTYRNPCVLAKIAATVDHISGGRAVLGLGAGWQENEHLAYGIDLPFGRENGSLRGSGRHHQESLYE